MSVSEITSDAWPDILRIEREVYGGKLAEHADVLKSKWRLSPECCFVYRTEERQIEAFLLAHAWNSEVPPALSAALSADVRGDILCLHDLAVSSRLRGLGVGRMLFERLLQVAGEREFRKILLVSVQQSWVFWSKMGFNEQPDPGGACLGYGRDARLMSLDLGV